jgi:hypothetical protein
MQVVAFSSPSCRDWRWRLVSYAGDIVEESHEKFTTIAVAIAAGTQRMNDLNTVDLARPAPLSFRSAPGRSRL